MTTTVISCFLSVSGLPFLFTDTTHVEQGMQTVVGHVEGEDFKVTDCLLLKQSSGEDLHLSSQRLLGTGQWFCCHLHAARQQELTHQLKIRTNGHDFNAEKQYIRGSGSQKQKYQLDPPISPTHEIKTRPIHRPVWN